MQTMKKIWKAIIFGVSWLCVAPPAFPLPQAVQTEHTGQNEKAVEVKPRAESIPLVDGSDSHDPTPNVAKTAKLPKPTPQVTKKVSKKKSLTKKPTQN
jgi:hypothetical protein